MRPTDQLGAAALAYASLGYRVLPLHHPVSTQRHPGARDALLVRRPCLAQGRLPAATGNGPQESMACLRNLVVGALIPRRANSDLDRRPPPARAATLPGHSPTFRIPR